VYNLVVFRAHVSSSSQSLEPYNMVSALGSFFSSFNPIAFGVAFSLGFIILVRRPERLLPLDLELPKLQSVRTFLKRDA
jgi:hypothetical protein